MGGRTRGPHLPHHPALDGVRGIAVAAVLAFHAGFGWARGGFLGVSTFFTLSGFLITLLLLSEHADAGRIGLGRFWARRARRLLPALALTLVGVTAFGATVATPDQLGRLRADGLATLAYVANWRFLLSGQSYAALFASPSPLLHAWSLAIEEQFYVVFPLLVAGVLSAARGSRRVLTAVIGALASGSVVLMVALHHPGADPSRVYYGTDTRAAEILAGALLGLWWSARGPARSRAGRAAAAAGGVLALTTILAAWTIARETSGWLYEGGLAAYTLAGVGLVTAALHPGPVRTVLAWRPLCWLGRVSYGVYLFHWPVFLWLSPARTGLGAWPLLGLRLAVVLPLAEVSSRLVEQPIRTGRLLTGRRPVAVVPAVVAALVVALVATTAHAPPPSVLVSGASASVAAPAPRSPATRSGERPGARSGVPTLLIIGDSVALTIGAGAQRVAGDLGVAVVNRGGLGCGLAGGSGRVRLGDGRIVTEHPDCARWPERWAADVAQDRPDVVLVVLAAWDAADHERGGRWLHPCQSDFDTRYEGDVERAIRLLGSRGAPVVLATAPYLRSGVVTADRTEGDRRVDCLNASFRRAAAAAARTPVVDLGRWVCPTRATCRSTADNAILRPDGVHYDGPGGPAVARWLVPRALVAAGIATRAVPA